jgi:hypothetical protein
MDKMSQPSNNTLNEWREHPLSREESKRVLVACLAKIRASATERNDTAVLAQMNASDEEIAEQIILQSGRY